MGVRRYCGGMASQRTSRLVNFIWALGGLTLGACLALLVLKNLDPNWVVATGTWFGAVVTVLTLLWAVRAFRSDQAEREVTRKDEHEKEVKVGVQRARKANVEASQVTVAMKGGAANGTPPNQMMTSLHIVIHNHSKYSTVIKHIALDDALIPKTPLENGFSIPAGETYRKIIEIRDVPARKEDLSGKPMTRFTAQITYRLNGSGWRRDSDNEQAVAIEEI